MALSSANAAIIVVKQADSL